MIVAIDFNQVIHDQLHPVPGKKMGPPIQGAKESLEAMKQEGHTIVIFSDMAAEKGLQTLMDWLAYYEIPYDRITNTKGDFDVLIDDKAIRFESWFRTLVELRRIEEQQYNW